MHGRKSAERRFVGTQGTILLAACLSQCHPYPPRPVRAGERREAATIDPGLVAAIRDADSQTVRKVIEGGADVNARDAEGNTPLILASFYASPECVAVLLEKGADAKAANEAGVTALIRAAASYEKVLALVNAGASVRVRTAGLGNTPLILAARRAGNSRSVELLLRRGADAAERNNAGVSPIISGAASGDLDTVRLLLDGGADANDFPGTNDPRADAAAGFRTPLMWAAYRNDERMVRLLVDRGADPNRSTYFGSPLSHACWGDGFEAAACLIDRGADVAARDAVAGFTPLHWAAGDETLRPHMVRLLLGSGADPNAAGGEAVGALGLAPQTPLTVARKRGRTAIVDALVAAGAREQPRPGRVDTPGRALPGVTDRSTLIASAEKALAALQTSAAESRVSFLRHSTKQDCVSCHQQYLPMAAVGHARERSIRFDREAAKEQIDLVVNPRGPSHDRESVAQALFHPDPAHSFGYRLFGLAAEGVPPDAMTDAEAHHLVTIQAPDGRWAHNIPRPPMASSDVTTTALSVQAVKRYGWRGRGGEFAASVGRARRWLWGVAPQTNEEAVFQLLGLSWSGGEPLEKLDHLARLLLGKQREDGGWAQLPTLESDAYATGEALYALARSGKNLANDPACRRGLRFLLESQGDDGTWHVARRSFPFQPTMRSGFPHHRDSWVSAAATSWAVLALTQAAPAGAAPGKPASPRPSSPGRTSEGQPKVDFTRQIRPLLERSCVACHSGGNPRGLFRIDGRESVLKGGASGEAAVIPGRSGESPLIDYVSGDVTDSEMPPRAQRDRFPALRAEDVALLRAWIDQGVEWPGGPPLSVPTVEKR